MPARGALLLACALGLAGCLPYKFPTQAAFHHAAALEAAPPDRVEGHLAGFERELSDLAFIKNEVVEADLARLRRSIPVVLRYVDDRRRRVRVSSMGILNTLRELTGPFGCAQAADALIGDGDWATSKLLVYEIASGQLPDEYYYRLRLLDDCRDDSRVQALARRVLEQPDLIEAERAAEGEYTEARVIRELARDLLRGDAASPSRLTPWR